MITKVLMIALGGSLGAVSRYALGRWVQQASQVTFPWGTFVVNVAGCLAMGLLAPLLLERVREETRLAIQVGFLGAMTTWSTFGLDTIQQLNERQFVQAAGNVLLTNASCLLAVFIGYRLSMRLVTG